MASPLPKNGDLEMVEVRAHPNGPDKDEATLMRLGKKAVLKVRLRPDIGSKRSETDELAVPKYPVAPGHESQDEDVWLCESALLLVGVSEGGLACTTSLIVFRHSQPRRNE